MKNSRTQTLPYTPVDHHVDAFLAKRARFGSVIYTVLYFSIGFGTTIFKDHPTQSAVLGGMIVTVGVFRALMAMSFGHWKSKTALWRPCFYVGALLASVTWGSFCFMTVQQYGVGETTFVVLFPTAGIAAGSILSFAPLIPLIATHLSLLLVPAIVSMLILKQSANGLTFAILTSLYFLYLLVQSKEICQMARADLLKSQIIVDQRAALLAEKSKSEAAANTKERFLAMMSHEIRTPLNGILGASGLILAEQTDPKLVEQASIIRTGGENLLLILNDILDFSEMARSHIDLDKKPFNFPQCISEVVGLFDSIAQRKDLQLKHFIDPSVPLHFLGDSARLKQILVNIIGNAVKFTDRGEIAVTVVARLNDQKLHELTISVTDTGAGIDESVLPKLFEMFTLGDESNQRRFGGAGLGLAISKKICEGMGGTIQVRSELGRGSTFYFSILLESTSVPQPVLLTIPVDVPACGKKYRVLSVDDQAANQALISAYLVKGGYIVDTAANGVEAVEAQQKKVYDAILMDCQMPQMDGFEATRQIRRSAIHHSVPIIAVTANALEGDRDKCLNAGMNDYITKPVRFPALMKVLSKWVRESELEKDSA